MPINRTPKLRGVGLPGAYDRSMLSVIADGQIPAWNATNQRWEAVGEIPDSFLSSNVPLLDAPSNAFTGSLTVNELQVPHGSAADPSITFLASGDTGFYYNDTFTFLGVSVGGTLSYQFGTSGLNLRNGATLYIEETASANVDISGRGQIWVRASDSALMYTSPSGVDRVVQTA